MNAHTPKPWERTGTTVYALTHAGWRKGKEQKKNRFTASVSGDPETPAEEVEANAQLMEAAPDLAEVLDPGPLGFFYQLDLAIGLLRGDYPPESIDMHGLADYLTVKLHAARAALRKAGLLKEEGEGRTGP